ncbi:CHAT domain-containing protein [Streptomyces sp. WAC05374]|uniref:CHAT domain-containing protein n=1 Tax=Streptomyces sp. WAC05374 TaxID=2487420 RepID=UPI000F868288|nr:CHAT domain-containing protein [Streptomyces sp. WAC05374]RST16478.1 CHAT domain-containing protein [Streptomyces sp. WAC05374]TDF54676.1 CHAT domain-containing protein [Streptomyces sp. WAC05374]TDF56312.1 CHAT domain-containing protein [Streptomyces sp. WAC05374]
MPRELPVRVVHDPSARFTHFGHRVTRAPDLTVTLVPMATDDAVHAQMFGGCLPELAGGPHAARLPVKPSVLRAATARLCALWNDLLVGHEPLDDHGRPAAGRPRNPYKDLADLSDQPEAELTGILEELALVGTGLLWDVLLGSEQRPVRLFRGYLLNALSGRGLRLRFDSDLPVPWPMLCLPPDAAGPQGLDGLFDRYLGHRHQIEQTLGTYPMATGPVAARRRPTVSLNHDTTVGRRCRSQVAEVAAALAQDTDFVERTTRKALLDDLARPELDEQLMYFWCHGYFLSHGSQPPHLAVKLTDAVHIDARSVAERRKAFGESTPFQPFVFLNACHAGLAGETLERPYLGRALIESGAQGVLGPLIEMPQVFAAEYARVFVTRYLEGVETAGEIAHDLARHFAGKFRNPLGLAYALHRGMDSRLERAR